MVCAGKDVSEDRSLTINVRYLFRSIRYYDVCPL